MTASGSKSARHGLEGILAPIAQLELRRAAGGQLHQLMIEEGHAGLQPPGHGHVVHPLDRVVHDQGGHVHAQDRVQDLVRAGSARSRDQAGAVILAAEGSATMRRYSS